MLSAIRPPDAILPMRNGDISFSSDDPPIYVNNGEGDDVDPIEPESGRINNHGFEGLSVSDDGKSLWALLQIAGAQEGVSAQIIYSQLLKSAIGDAFLVS